MNDNLQKFLAGIVAGLIVFGIPAVVYIWITGGL